MLSSQLIRCATRPAALLFLNSNKFLLKTKFSSTASAPGSPSDPGLNTGNSESSEKPEVAKSGAPATDAKAKSIDPTEEKDKAGKKKKPRLPKGVKGDDPLLFEESMSKETEKLEPEIKDPLQRTLANIDQKLNLLLQEIQNISVALAMSGPPERGPPERGSQKRPFSKAPAFQFPEGRPFDRRGPQGGGRFEPSMEDFGDEERGSFGKPFGGKPRPRGGAPSGGAPFRGGPGGKPRSGPGGMSDDLDNDDIDDDFGEEFGEARRGPGGAGGRFGPGRMGPGGPGPRGGSGGFGGGSKPRPPFRR